MKTYNAYRANAGSYLWFMRIEESTSQTLGFGCIFDAELQPLISFATIEPPFNANKKSISAIRKGTYNASKIVSPKFGNAIWIQNVAGRSEILIHVLNFARQSKGCIGVGSAHRFLDADELRDVIQSQETLNAMLFCLKENFQVTIL